MTSCLHMNDKYNLAKLQDDKEKIERLIAHQSRRIGHVFPKEMEHEFWAKNLERARKHVEKYVRESGVHEHICYQLCCIEIFGKEKMQSQILGEVDAVALGDDGTQKHQHIND